MQNLIKLKKILRSNRDNILRALYQDLGKSEEEALLTEYIPVMKELDLFIKKAPLWKRAKRVWGTFSLLGCRSYVQRVPYGDVLIISPWNYPFQLALLPLIGALGSGNRVTLKPSEVSSNTEEILKKILTELNIPEVKIVTGDHRAAQTLLQQKFHYIFFTGSSAVGKLVYQAAAQNLTPVTLELGGKSPVIIEPDANLEEAVEKILWGKFLNCGQTCVAPDYVYLPREKVHDFLRLSKDYEKKFSSEMGKIINERHYNRLVELAEGKITLSPEDRKNLKFPFLLLLNPHKDSPVMREEIFGPILPLIEYDPDTLHEVYREVIEKPRPLALYIFRGNGKNLDTGGIVSGGVCINGTVLQVADPSLPFGGAGESGLGNYHGKYSFQTFTYEKSVLESTTLNMEFFRKISRWMVKNQK